MIGVAAAEQRQGLALVGVAAARVAVALGGSVALLALGRLAVLADELGLLLDLGLGLFLDARRREGGDRDLLGVLGDELDAVGDRRRRRAEGCR